MPAIETLMKDCDTKPKELTKIVVAQGPGSYTGVQDWSDDSEKLGMDASDSVIGVSSLEVLAANGRYFNGLISPLFDARRGQIYTGLYEYGKGFI